MVDQRIKRKLAAILALDVVGFSKLMHADDAAAFALVRRMGSEIFAPSITRFNGEIFKHTGDGVLARFDSVNDAFEAAEEIIRLVIAAGEASLRIGIHLGDVIADGGDVFGDSVNIACRLESLALHNGICISERAWSDLRQRKIDFRDLGIQQLKNIETPIRVYLYDPSGTGDFTTAAARRPAGGVLALHWRKALLVGGLVLAGLGAALMVVKPWSDTPQEVLGGTLDAVPCSWLAAMPIEQTPSRLIARISGYSNLAPDRVRALVLAVLADVVAGDVTVDVAGVGTIPELDCGFVEAAAQYKYAGAARAELVRTLASADPVAFASYANKVPDSAQVIYDVRLFTDDFPANAELFAIDAVDGLQHIAAVSEVKAGDENDTGTAGGVRHAMIWSDTATPILFFILDSDQPIDVDSLQQGYDDVASMRAFRDAAEAGNWRFELIMLHQPQAAQPVGQVR